MEQKKPSSRLLNNCLGIDFGLAKYGLAIGNVHTKRSYALKILNAKNGFIPMYIFDSIIRDYKVDTILIGDTISTHYKIKILIKALQALFISRHPYISTYLIDEYCTTKEALTLLGRSANVKDDSLAAELMLHYWLYQ